MSRTRVAVVGLGAIAFEHLERLTARDDVEVAGVCDLSATLTRAMAERFAVPLGMTDAVALLDEVRPDAVHVLTPPAAHPELAVAALERGAHVLVEKPIATTAAGYAEMREAALAAGRMLVENHNYRFTPALLQAAGQTGAGRPLGELVGVDVVFAGVMGSAYDDRNVAHFAHALPGGALRNFVSHPASIAVALLGAPVEVHAVRRRLDPGFASDDELRVLCGMPAAWATLGVSRRQQPPRFTVALEGTRGRAEVDIFGNRFVFQRGDGGAVANATRDVVARAAGAATLAGRALAGRKDPFSGLSVLLDGFYRAVRRPGPPPVTLEQLDAVMGIVDAALAAEEHACV